MCAHAKGRCALVLEDFCSRLCVCVCAHARVCGCYVCICECLCCVVSLTDCFIQYVL